MADNERTQRGVEVMKKLWGDGAAQALDVSDPLVEISAQHLFGEVWSRPGLAMRDRSLITCATLVALGKENELKIHLRGLMNQGVTKEQVEEMMIHLLHYAGWPAGVGGMHVAREVFKERGA